METWLSAVLGGIGVAFIGLLGNVVIQWMNRRKTAAEARSTDADYGVKITASAVTLINELQDEVTELRRQATQADADRKVQGAAVLELQKQVAALIVEVGRLKFGIGQLTEQLRALGHEPRWKP